MKEPSSEDFDFRNQIRNTIILLGGSIEVANLMTKSQDCGITDADVEELKRYNQSLIDQLKGQLDNIGKMQLRT